MIVPFITSIPPESAMAWREALQTALPDHRVCDPSELTQDERRVVTVAVIANPDPEALAAFESLEWVHSVWAGVDRLVGALDPRIGIVRLVDPDLARTMAEGVLGHVLYLHRRLPEYLAQQRAGLWRQLDQPAAEDRCVAVLGMGHLGRQTAARLRDAGFRVVGWSRSLRTMPGVESRSGLDTLHDVLTKADIVVVLLPLTEDTRGLLNADTLSSCGAHASLINVARGPILDRDALIAALDREQLHHAVLDVFDHEPLPPDDRLWSHPSVTVLPHVAAPTNRATASAIVARNLSTYFESGEIPPPVDPAQGY